MTARIYLQLGQSTAEPVNWARFKDDACIETGHAENIFALDELAQKVADEKVVAILPGELVAHRVLPSPPKSTSQFKTAARYMLEDELAESVDDLHVVTHRPNGAGYALALKKRVVDEWRSAFKELGLSVDALTPDFLLLTPEDSGRCIVLDGERLIVRLGDRGFASDARLGVELLNGILVAEGDAENEEFVLDANSTAVNQNPDPAIEKKRLKSLFTIFHKGANAPVDLLEGAGRIRQPIRDQLGAWTRPAMLAASLAALGFLTFIAGGVNDWRVAGNFNREARALHTEHFPDAANVDPRTHARSIIGAAGGGNFLELAAAFTAALEETQQADVDRIRYDEARARLIVSVRSQDDSAIEALRAALNKRGVIAEDAGGYRRTGDEWFGDMIVRTQ